MKPLALRFDDLPYSLAVALLWASGLLLLALRSWHLDADPLPVSWSGDLLTDEGWYSKAALLKARFGHWTTPGDLTPITHNALHSVLLWLAFEAGGVSLANARAVCAGLYVGGVAVLAGAFGRRTGAWGGAGLLLCLVAGHFMGFVYSRLALTDVSAGGFTMLALGTWLAGPRRGMLSCGPSLVVTPPPKPMAWPRWPSACGPTWAA